MFFVGYLLVIRWRMEAVRVFILASLVQYVGLDLFVLNISHGTTERMSLNQLLSSKLTVWDSHS